MRNGELVAVGLFTLYFSLFTLLWNPCASRNRAGLYLEMAGRRGDLERRLNGDSGTGENGRRSMGYAVRSREYDVKASPRFTFYDSRFTAFLNASGIGRGFRFA